MVTERLSLVTAQQSMLAERWQHNIDDDRFIGTLECKSGVPSRSISQDHRGSSRPAASCSEGESYALDQFGTLFMQSVDRRVSQEAIQLENRAYV